jgi:hypothetical protein
MLLLPPLAFAAGEPDVAGLPHDEIRLDGELYMERYYLSADRRHRLHHIVASDRDRDLHDHPWDFVSVLLTGAYLETTAEGEVLHRAPAIVWRRAEAWHRLDLVDGPMWTCVTTGPVRRRWGFHTPGGWVHWRDYERRNAPPATTRAW